MKRNNPEAKKQAELISRLNEWGNFVLFKDYMKWVHHVPNGGHRSKGSASEMKAIGAKSGVHDLCCPWPTHKYGMATVEMKSDVGSTSAKQDDYTDFMKLVGNISLTTNCVDEAERFIIKYMIDSLKAPHFEILEALDTEHYYFDGSTASSLSSEEVRDGLFTGDIYTQQKHAIKIIKRINNEKD